MRIWHQSFTVLEDLPAYAERMRQHIRLIVRPETVVDLHGMMPGTYPADYPGDDLSYSFLFSMHGNQWIINALKAASAGYDAYAMCTLPDPRLREIRTIVDIPVVGAGETCFHIASMTGQRFGMLLFNDRMIARYSDQLRAYGLSERCAGVRPVGFGFQEALQGFDNPGLVIEKFRDAARKLIAEGADVIIPGEIPLNVLLASEGVRRVDDVPLIDAFGLTIKMAETMVDLKASTGLSHSRHGWFNSAPDMERIRDVMKLYFRNEWLPNGPKT